MRQRATSTSDRIQPIGGVLAHFRMRLAASKRRLEALNEAGVGCTADVDILDCPIDVLLRCKNESAGPANYLTLITAAAARQKSASGPAGGIRLGGDDDLSGFPRRPVIQLARHHSGADHARTFSHRKPFNRGWGVAGPAVFGADLADPDLGVVLTIFNQGVAAPRSETCLSGFSSTPPGVLPYYVFSSFCTSSIHTWNIY